MEIEEKYMDITGTWPAFKAREITSIEKKKDREERVQNEHLGNSNAE